MNEPCWDSLVHQSSLQQHDVYNTTLTVCIVFCDLYLLILYHFSGIKSNIMKYTNIDFGFYFLVHCIYFWFSKRDLMFSHFLSKNQISAYFYVEVQNMVNSGRPAAELWRMFDFEYGGRPPSWIFVLSQYLSKIQPSAYFYVDEQNLVKIGLFKAELFRIFKFLKWRPSAILDLVWRHSGPSTTCIDGPDIVLKSHVDSVYTLQDIAIFIFRPFGLKLPIHAPLADIAP